MLDGKEGQRTLKRKKKEVDKWKLKIKIKRFTNALARCVHTTHLELEIKCYEWLRVNLNDEGDKARQILGHLGNPRIVAYKLYSTRPPLFSHLHRPPTHPTGMKFNIASKFLLFLLIPKQTLQTQTPQRVLKNLSTSMTKNDTGSSTTRRSHKKFPATLSATNGKGTSSVSQAGTINRVSQ